MQLVVYLPLEALKARKGGVLPGQQAFDFGAPAGDPSHGGHLHQQAIQVGGAHPHTRHAWVADKPLPEAEHNHEGFDVSHLLAPQRAQHAALLASAREGEVGIEDTDGMEKHQRLAASHTKRLAAADLRGDRGWASHHRRRLAYHTGYMESVRRREAEEAEPQAPAPTKQMAEAPKAETQPKRPRLSSAPVPATKPKDAAPPPPAQQPTSTKPKDDDGMDSEDIAADHQEAADYLREVELPFPEYSPARKREIAAAIKAHETAAHAHRTGHADRDALSTAAGAAKDAIGSADNAARVAYLHSLPDGSKIQAEVGGGGARPIFTKKGGQWSRTIVREGRWSTADSRLEEMTVPVERVATVGRFDVPTKAEPPAPKPDRADGLGSLSDSQRAAAKAAGITDDDIVAIRRASISREVRLAGFGAPGNVEADRPLGTHALWVPDGWGENSPLPRQASAAGHGGRVVVHAQPSARKEDIKQLVATHGRTHRVLVHLAGKTIMVGHPGPTG